MRSWLGALVVAAVCLAPACSRQVTGAAVPDPHRPGVAVDDDGSGIVMGFFDAPVRLEIFTEPQCPGCAQLQHQFGDAINFYVLSGRLVVTYRPETFIDGLGTQYSARVANALFLAGDSAASATAFQSYVMTVWANQDTEGSAGPSDAQLAQWARDVGIPAKAAERIAAGVAGVDVAAMSAANIELLDAVCAPYAPSTPTVYDVNDDEIVDTTDEDWLDRLFARV